MIRAFWAFFSIIFLSSFCLAQTRPPLSSNLQTPIKEKGLVAQDSNGRPSLKFQDDSVRIENGRLGKKLFEDLEYPPRKGSLRDLNLKSLEGGSTGVGGGGGVMCGGTWTLEYWVATNLYHNEFFKISPSDKTWRDYLERVLRHQFARPAPEFLQTLLSFVEKLDPEKWPDEEISLIDDLGPDYSSLDQEIKNQNCSRVQLARRSDSIPADGKRSYQFAFNRRLFNSLGVDFESRIINQAVLILHEALYWINAELNETRVSQNTQSFIHSILNPRAWSSEIGLPNKSYRIRELLRDVYWDAFFKLDFHQRSAKTQARVASYQNAVRLLNLAYTENKLCGVCRGDADIDPKPGTNGRLFVGQLSYTNSPLKLMSGRQKSLVEDYFIRTLLPQLTNEEAFLLVVSDYQDLLEIDDVRLESLFFDGPAETATFQKVCKYTQHALTLKPDIQGKFNPLVHLKIGDSGRDWGIPLLKKASAYCTQ